MVAHRSTPGSLTAPERPAKNSAGSGPPRFFFPPALYARLPRRGRATLVAALNLLIAAQDADGCVLGGQAARAASIGISTRALRDVEARLERGGVLRVQRGQARNRSLLALLAPSTWLPPDAWDAAAMADAVLLTSIVENPGVRKSRAPECGTQLPHLSHAHIEERARVITSDRRTDRSSLAEETPGESRPAVARPGSPMRLVARIQRETGISHRATRRVAQGLLAAVGARGLDEVNREVARVLAFARTARNPAAYAFACLAAPGLDGPGGNRRHADRGGGAFVQHRSAAGRGPALVDGPHQRDLFEDADFHVEREHDACEDG